MTSADAPSPPAEQATEQDTDDRLLAALRAEDAHFPSSGAIAVGLIGAALGAGVGWVASRSVRRGPVSGDTSSAGRAEVVERGWRGLRRAARRATRRNG